MKAQHLTGLCCAAALACSINVSAQTSAQQGTSSDQSQPSSTSGSVSTGASSTARSSDDNSDQLVTLVGCIQKESAASGQSAMASGNEFVLMNATMGTAGSASASTATPSSVGTSGSESAIGSEKPDADANASQSASSETASSGATDTEGTSGAVGTSGTMTSTSSHGTTYSLTGSREGEMERLVGKRVEITGKLEHDRSSAASSPISGAPNAGGRDDGSSVEGNAGRSTASASASGSTGASASASMPKVDVTRYREVGGSCGASEQ